MVLVLHGIWYLEISVTKKFTIAEFNLEKLSWLPLLLPTISLTPLLGKRRKFRCQWESLLRSSVNLQEDSLLQNLGSTTKCCSSVACSCNSAPEKVQKWVIVAVLFLKLIKMARYSTQSLKKQILTKITLLPLSVKSTPTYSGLTITIQVPPCCGGESGHSLCRDFCLQGGLWSGAASKVRDRITVSHTNWVPLRSSSASSNEVIFSALLFTDTVESERHEPFLYLVFKVLRTFLQSSCTHADTMPRNSCYLCHVKVKRLKNVRCYRKAIYMLR